jgi:hypothetical protein
MEPYIDHETKILARAELKKNITLNDAEKDDANILIEYFDKNFNVILETIFKKKIVVSILGCELFKMLDELCRYTGTTYKGEIIKDIYVADTEKLKFISLKDGRKV